MKRSNRTFSARLGSFVRVLFWIFFLAVTLTVGATLVVGHDIKEDLESTLPEVRDLNDLEERKITKVLSSDGKLIATLYREAYKPVSYDELGDNIRNAVVALEDARFYQHSGVDVRSVARAAIQNAMSGKIEQGASTITMQLARKLYLSNDRTYERKIREALLARKIEKEYSKDEILERYLNEVYFGAGAHGIGAASARYFEKTPAQLGVAEAALLAGLIQSPTHYNPYTNHRGARHRQVLVLTAMRDNGYINGEEYREALDQATTFSFNDNPTEEGPLLKYPYFSTHAIKAAVKNLGEEAVYEDGLTILTTVDLNAQRHLRNTLSDALSRHGAQYGVNQGAAVLIENETGKLRALVGGRSWNSEDYFNRATQAERQPGSTFKPLLYAAALERGYTQDSKLSDEKFEWRIQDGNKTKTWSPLNSDGKSRGRIPLREALRLSRNQATTDLMRQLGVATLLDMADRVGISSELPRVPSLALGTGLVTPLDMATAYSSFANGGVRTTVTPLKKVYEPNGTLAQNFSHRWTHQATSPEVTAELTDMLRRVVTSGTGRAAHIPGLDVAGKTGTTDSFRDAWFVGYTPEYTLAVWMGNDDNSKTYRLYGGSLPAQTWKRMMSGLPHSKKRFSRLAATPERVKYCEESDRLAQPYCEETYTVAYRVEPPETLKCRECKLEMIKEGDFTFIPGQDITLDEELSVDIEDGEVTTVEITPEAVEVPAEVEMPETVEVPKPVFDTGTTYPTAPSP